MAEVITEMIGFLNTLFSQIFTKLIIAVVILLIGFIIGRIADRLLQKFLHEIELDKIIKKAGLHIALEQGISHIIKYFIYFIAIIWALSEIGLTTTVLNMIAAAALALIVISILLAVKDFLPNAIAGFFIYQKKLIQQGDKIKLDKISGKVHKIGLVETQIKTSSGDMIHVPNSTLTKTTISVKKP